MSMPLKFEVISDKAYRPSSGDFIVRMAIRLAVPRLAESLPAHFMLLIDKSYSMQGSKLEEAKCAAGALLDALRPQDTLSMMAFGTSVELLVDRIHAGGEGLQAARQSIAALEAGGVTRMAAALDAAYQHLETTVDSHVNTLLLLSDGAPTDETGEVLAQDQLQNLQSVIAKAAQQQGVSTSTVGLGDAEQCLAPFLEACGSDGGGNFYHIRDPQALEERFRDALQQTQNTAISNLRFRLDQVHGKVRNAVAIFPSVRPLQTPETDDQGALWFNGGNLQCGEEYVFLVEVVTPPGAGKVLLSQVSAHYEEHDVAQTLETAPVLLEYSDEPSLLDKPDHGRVAEYKAMHQAFIQTQKAADQIRKGGDPKKTQILLSAAAKTTKQLGFSKQTKLLEAMARDVANGQVEANAVADMTSNSRKTKVLTA